MPDRAMLRRTLLSSCAATLIAGCRVGQPSEVMPDAGLVGCYHLEAGPWLSPAGTPLDPSPLATYGFVVPAVVELRPQESTAPVAGHWVLLPQPDGGPFRSATWRGRNDSLDLEWSTSGQLGDAMLLAKLGLAHTGEYRGRATVETDYLDPRPYRVIIARRAPCAG